MHTAIFITLIFASSTAALSLRRDAERLPLTRRQRGAHLYPDGDDAVVLGRGALDVLARPVSDFLPQAHALEVGRLVVACGGA